MPLQSIAHPSVQQIQSVRAVIDKEHAILLRIDRDAEEGAVPVGPRWRGAGVEHLDRDLFSGGRRLDQVAIPAVHRQDIAVWGDRQAQGDVQRPIDGDGRALAPGRAMQGVGDRGDPVGDAVSQEERAVAGQADAGRADHQRRGVDRSGKLSPMTVSTVTTGAPIAGRLKPIRTTVP